MAALRLISDIGLDRGTLSEQRLREVLRQRQGHLHETASLLEVPHICMVLQRPIDPEDLEQSCDVRWSLQPHHPRKLLDRVPEMRVGALHAIDQQDPQNHLLPGGEFTPRTRDGHRMLRVSPLITSQSTKLRAKVLRIRGIVRLLEDVPKSTATALS